LARNSARIVQKRNSYRVLAGNFEGKRPLRRPRGRWQDNIETDLKDGYGKNSSASVWRLSV
jgi:hypothetical protein